MESDFAKYILLANLEGGLSLQESLNQPQWAMQFTVKTTCRVTPFEMHHGRKPRNRLTNLAETSRTLLSNWEKTWFSENPTQLPVYNSRDAKGNVSDHIVMARECSVYCYNSIREMGN